MPQPLLRERQRDPAGADGEIEDRPVAGELGEEPDCLRLVTTRVLVIPGGDVRAEALQWIKALHGDPFLTDAHDRWLVVASVTTAVRVPQGVSAGIDPDPCAARTTPNSLSWPSNDDIGRAQFGSWRRRYPSGLLTPCRTYTTRVAERRASPSWRWAW